MAYLSTHPVGWPDLKAPMAAFLALGAARLVRSDRIMQRLDQLPDTPDCTAARQILGARAWY